MMTRPTLGTLHDHITTRPTTWSAHDGGGVGAGTPAAGPVQPADDDQRPAPTRRPLRIPALGARLPSLTAIKRIPWRAMIAPAFIAALIAGVIVNRVDTPRPATTLTAGFVATFGLHVTAEQTSCIATAAAAAPRSTVTWPATPADRAAIWTSAGHCLHGDDWKATAPVIVDRLGLPMNGIDRECVAKRIVTTIPANRLAGIDWTADRPYTADPSVAADAATAVDGCVDIPALTRRQLVDAGTAPAAAACIARQLGTDGLAALIAHGGLPVTTIDDGTTLDVTGPVVQAATAACSTPGS